MSAAPAYSYPQPSRAPQRAPRPQVRAIPGGRVREQGVSPQFVTLAKLAAVMLVAFAVVCCVRIALTAATVSTSIESQELTQQISQARKDGNALEVSQSALSNPTHVRAAAAELGMVEPPVTETIVLEPDVVATDEAGNLSLTRSLQRASGLGE